MHPDRVLAVSQGNTQILPNGNFFVNWGQTGSITEFRANDSTPIFNAYLDSGELGAGVQNYRGFRFEWTGKPKETPAIVAVKSRAEIKIYVSWNGDTETVAWRFFETRDGDVKDLGEVKRVSFETSLKIRVGKHHVESDAQFFAEAVDGAGEVITRTAVTDLRAEIRPKEDVGVFQYLKQIVIR